MALIEISLARVFRYGGRFSAYGFGLEFRPRNRSPCKHGMDSTRIFAQQDQ